MSGICQQRGWRSQAAARDPSVYVGTLFGCLFADHGAWPAFFVVNMNNKPPGPTIDDIYPSRWLRAEHLAQQSHVVTIADAAAEEIQQRDGSKEWKLVVTFAGAKRQLVCNVTQAKRLAELTGTTQYRAWAGTRVLLYPTLATNNKATIGISAAPDEPAKETTS